MQMSFGSLELRQRLRQDSVLMKIDALIDWEVLRPGLTGLYKRELSNGGGQEPFDALLMLKAILLGQWHSLSDTSLEQALCVRIDFLQFCGLSLSDKIPDETTLCRFRNHLVVNDRLDGLLASINEQIQSHGLMIKGATGAVIDATLIESAARPKKTITLEMDAEGKAVQFEDGSQPGIICSEEQSDAFRSGHRWCTHRSESGVCGQRISQQRQSTVPEKAQNQERDHASSVQEQTALGTPEAGE